MSISVKIASTSGIAGRRAAFSCHSEPRKFQMRLVTTWGVEMCPNGPTSVKDMLENDVFSRKILIGVQGQIGSDASSQPRT
jgi:hypothetical protein